MKHISIDGYLALFTPLSRRLNRSEIELSGEEIRTYLLEVFGSRLERRQIQLRATAAFDSSAVTGVSGIAKEIFDAVDEEPSLKNLLTLDGAILSGSNIRIRVLSKPQTMGTSDVDKVEEHDLPERLMEEFAELSKGLLTSFALHSIAAVRRAAHHLVTVFQHDLDGAFLGHRCASKQPEDSRDFAVELHRVGLDQLEWLRLASNKNSASDFKPQLATNIVTDA